eukprot:gnl/MRDRNA2_/MRDRNA2_156950_c0_seq1.p1 gnl/MRDRNA2_/MRDRNA2_156950_c0~~gnl/MRDRNA2_/MRDRNA2_156950_c0_seq1.p1  ORF type:complete len:111 (+),score=5.55 gnl/MRDRNA2_/MRDRNA2_156950_c0_seq1:3-335(+)
MLRQPLPMSFRLVEVEDIVFRCTHQCRSNLLLDELWIQVCENPFWGRFSFLLLDIGPCQIALLFCITISVLWYFGIRSFFCCTHIPTFKMRLEILEMIPSCTQLKRIVNG